MPPTAMVILVFSGLPCAWAWPKVNQPARNSASAIRNCFQNFLLYMRDLLPVWTGAAADALEGGRAAVRQFAMLPDGAAHRIGINT
ncbi:exported hypothetical protein [Cupriavidus taiwanensis]|uniref:Secreted protein n=1 Tax=Cupriavidus taiwanensis TaxID=164546 RepID=A0A975WY82_9BURK|nr:exported hypothetical protein [Cupriavidus taiwanensis]